MYPRFSEVENVTLELLDQTALVIQFRLIPAILMNVPFGHLGAISANVRHHVVQDSKFDHATVNLALLVRTALDLKKICEFVTVKIVLFGQSGQTTVTVPYLVDQVPK